MREGLCARADAFCFVRGCLSGQGRLPHAAHRKNLGGLYIQKRLSVSYSQSLSVCFSVQYSYFCVRLYLPAHCFFFFYLWEVVFPFPAEELLLARRPSRGGLEPRVLPAAPFSWSGCPGAQVSLGKPEMAARQVSCWFPCSSFLLLAEENLIFFFFLAIIMGCEEQLLN